MNISVINRSSIVSLEEAMLWTTAWAMQLRDDVAPLWERVAPLISFHGTGDVDHPRQIVLLDDADQAGLLGYHDVNPLGVPYAKVFARTTRDNGGSIPACGSHEAIEMFLNANCGGWQQGSDGRLYAIEGCDGVEGDSYTKRVGDTDVEVSNFVLPAYFDAKPPAGSRFDFLGKLSGPAPAMTPGGYLIVAGKTEEGQEFAKRVVYGEDYPEWKKPGKAHPASRTSRRLRA